MHDYEIGFKKISTDKDPTLWICVGSSGEVLSASVYCEFFDDYIDCTQKIKDSEYWCEKAMEKFLERKAEPDESEWEYENDI